MGDGAVVLLSGGQDSTTCLMLAIERYGVDNVQAVTFDYSQSHRVELTAATKVAHYLGIDRPYILSVPALHELGGGALTNEDIPVASNATGTGNIYAAERGLPSTVVPGRNVVFLALAAGLGAKLGYYSLWTGGCLADYEGYPDCRPEFYRAMQEALREALLVPELEIVTPLTEVSKADTFAIAKQLGHLDLLVEHTHTCYHGDRTIRHEWGYGCGECPACQTRAFGWHEFIERTKV